MRKLPFRVVRISIEDHTFKGNLVFGGIASPPDLSRLVKML
jgi:hypothetical protein